MNLGLRWEYEPADAIESVSRVAGAARWYSGRPLLFGTSDIVSGNPKLTHPTRRSAVRGLQPAQHDRLDNPELNLSSASFGKVTRKRIDAQGREIQLGARFVF